MGRNRMRGFRLVFLMGALLFLAACGLPGDLKKEAEQQKDRISATRTAVLKKKASYLEVKQSDRFAFFAPYATRENWDAHFTEAEDRIAEAEKAVTTGAIAALLREDNADKAGALRVELAKNNRMLRDAMQASVAADQRMADLVRIRDNAPKLVQTAQASLSGIHDIIADLEQSFIPKAQQDHANRADDIFKRFEPLKKIQEQSDAALLNATAQLNLHTTGSVADYAVLGAETDRVNANLEALKKADADYRNNVRELYRSYAKILEDMRIEYFVRVGRVSWDEDSDFWTEHNYIYPPSQVDFDTYEHFRTLNPNAVPCTYTRSKGMRYTDNLATKSIWSKQHNRYFDVNYWNNLHVNAAQNWPDNRDDWAEFWIEDVFAKAYHRYTMLENDKRQTTDWIEVDEEDYYDNYDFLGMEIVNKPYGVFEDERVQSASPPGMAFVGDSRYGEWRSDASTGRSFWHYYGIYSFLNRGPGFYYYRGDWDTWRRNYRGREPYYGGTPGTGGVYGTWGSRVRTDSRYQNTTFAQSGGLRTQAASVRGAGPGRRGGGPGGRGK